VGITWLVACDLMARDLYRVYNLASRLQFNTSFLLLELSSLPSTIERLRKHKLYTKLSKYFFNVKEVEFLGFIVGSIEVKPDPNKILIIKKWPKPKLFYKV
jgi:hypothetical protein